MNVQGLHTLALGSWSVVWCCAYLLLAFRFLACVIARSATRARYFVWHEELSEELSRRCTEDAEGFSKFELLRFVAILLVAD